jgi:hypothetical protein
LGLTKQEIVNYASSFKSASIKFSIPLSIFNFFIPGGRKMIFEPSKDGNGLTVSFLIGDGKERLLLPSDELVVRNDVWDLPEKLLKTINSILLKQLGSAYSDVETASSFFEWFCNIFFLFWNPTHYPLQIQILNALIWLWSSGMFEKLRCLIFSDYFFLSSKFLDELIENIIFCIYFLMVIQRLKAPFGSNNNLLKVIVGNNISSAKNNDVVDMESKNVDIRSIAVPLTPLSTSAVSEVCSDSNFSAESRKINNPHIFLGYKNFENFDDDEIESNKIDEIDKMDERSCKDSIILDNDSEISKSSRDLYSSDVLSQEYNIIYHTISKKLFYSFYYIYMKLLEISKTLQDFHNISISEEPGCILYSDSEFRLFESGKSFHGVQNNSHVLNSKLTNGVLLLQDKKTQSIVFHISGFGYYLNNEDFQKNVCFGGEWIPSHYSLYSLPVTPTVAYVYNVFYSSILNSNCQNAQVCGPLVICDETNYNVGITLITDIFHFFNHNIHVFYCTPLTDLSNVVRFLFSHLVDSHWVIFMNLENLSNFLISCLIDICFIFFFFIFFYKILFSMNSERN